ncbi:hypothetical protein GLYMA_09G270650v4 [Glycine max]|nr:hypothetical protein GLYMA_09G270650v4 [Glycine max]
MTLCMFLFLMCGLPLSITRLLETNERICFLNVCPHEVIHSLFYNKYIRRGKPDAGFSLFQSECLKWSGYVEFDNLKKNVLTYLAENSIYKVFDLN